MLSGEHITVRYGNCAVVDDLSFRLDEGEWLMLAGPNGAGKSTLIEAIAQGVPYTGAIRWEKEDIRNLKGSRLARRIGVLSQKNNVSYAYTVEEVVGLGRYAYKNGLFSGRDDGGKEQVEKALEMTGLAELRHASIQKHIFSLIREWLKEPGRAVLSVVHDLSLARRYGTHAILMDQGKSVSRGPIGEVMTSGNLEQVYGMNVYEWMQEMLSQWQE